jgi:hypothetical protein
MRWLADENFRNHVVRGLRLRNAGLDIVRVQDAGLVGLADPALLDWAAGHGRVLLTHDLRTIPNYAYSRIEARLEYARRYSGPTNAPCCKCDRGGPFDRRL